ncbi:MAG: hypothetical protein QOI80_917, partial [Solirubrobacteraceae bacterium]|nr:hypothetical protein [Solirubrobacteraceae bacterium]
MAVFGLALCRLMQRWRLGLVFLLVLATAAPARADLVDVATVDGTILDATPQQVLYRTTGNAPQVKLLDVAGGQTQTIPLTAASSNDFQRGALIPGGAVIATDTTNFPFRELQEWQSGGVLTNLGGLNSSFDAAGDYVTWTSGQGHDLNRLQVSTSIATPVAANALNTGNHVDAGSGDVVFAGTVSGQSGYEVFRWHNGVTTPLSHQLPARWAIEPEVDGSLVAYALRSPDGTVGGLAFHDGLTETVLDAARWGGATAGDFALSGGWLAFDRAHDPAFQPDEVWTRSPG